MAMRATLCFALSGLTATATAQTAPAPESWTPISRTAKTITGRVTFASPEIYLALHRRACVHPVRLPDQCGLVTSSAG